MRHLSNSDISHFPNGKLSFVTPPPVAAFHRNFIKKYDPFFISLLHNENENVEEVDEMLYRKPVLDIINGCKKH